MSWRRRAAATAAVTLAAGLATLAQPSPPQATANPVCDLAGASVDRVTGGVDAVTGGALGFGNPIGDACKKVSGELVGAATAPLDAAVEGIGNSVFGQLTSWVSEGATWLIGRVVKAIDKTTTPQVASKSFLSQYMKMAAIGAVMAVAMLLLAVLEGLAQGNSALLVRVALVNAPLAMIATTVAYAVVQLLLVVTDGLCAAISASSDHGSQRFFETAITGLGQAGGSIGKDIGGAGPAGPLAGQAGGTVGVPLFVAFLAAIVGAFAAFFVWLELLMRDAAVYVVSLFLPLSLAASIWPRWMDALRRTAELLFAVIASKFVIVAIVGLAAALVANGDGGIEHVLAASALMLLACFAPFVLIKLVPFAEGAIGAAYSRRSASGGAVSGVQMASDAAILRGMVAARRGDSGVTLWGSEGGAGGGGHAPGGGGRGGKGDSGGRGAGATGGPRGGGSSSGGGAGGGAAAGGAGGSAGAAAAAVPAAVGRGVKGAAGRMSQSGAASQAKEAGSASPPAGETPKQAGASEAGSSPSAGERPPRPRSDPPPTKPGEEGSS